MSDITAIERAEAMRAVNARRAADGLPPYCGRVDARVTDMLIYELVECDLIATREDRQRYVYLGDRLTDPALVGQVCGPVRREDGRCIVGGKLGSALVRLADGREVVVMRRRLRLNAR